MANMANMASMSSAGTGAQVKTAKTAAGARTARGVDAGTGVPAKPKARKRKSARESRIETAESRKVLVTVEEAAHRLSIGRATCYRLVARGALRSVLIGRMRRVPVEALDEFATAAGTGRLVISA